jgi:glycosyltransferase involved in cell wall biosynthesis
MTDQTPARSITFLLSYSSIFHLGAWRHSIELWTRKGYTVNLVQFKDEHIQNLGSELEKKYNLIQIPYPLIFRSIFYLVKFAFRSIRKLGFDKLSTIGDGIDYLFKGYYYVIFTLFKLRKHESTYYIGGDPPALYAAYLLSKKRKKKLIFWELELLLENEQSDFGRRLFKKIEKKCSKYVICAIEFGEKRCELLREENAIPDSVPIFSIPNSLLDEPKLERNYYFNEKFSIPREKKIVLFAGGIFTDAKEISDLWESVETWPDNFVLVIHSRIKPSLMQKLVIPEKLKSNGKIFFNDEAVPYDMLNNIYASCDIGLILIRLKGEMNSNLFYSDLSLGKLFRYLFSGVPVISRRLYGYTELIEKNGVGLCFDDPIEINKLIYKIFQQENYYKTNCLSFCKSYSFNKYHAHLERFIDT